jgi:heterodisulfide reductase subunit A-like polyferredoxin
VHEDVGLEVGKEIIRKIAGALGHPTPAAPSAKDSREMMINKLWRTHGLDEVKMGECSPQLKKCLHDVITELGYLNVADMKEQITIRMTNKTMHQNPSPTTLLPRTVN